MPGRLLDREEYIEQAYLFRVFRERLDEDVPSQEVISGIAEEILATTKLPMALDFLKGELLLTGRISDGMARLRHYFTPFQTFIMDRSEEEGLRFDQKTALQILERLADYLSESPTPAGLFIYQFECVARNRLGYDAGMTAIADDPFYDDDWRDWILKTRLRLGTTDFAELIYYRSEHWLQERRRRTGQDDYRASYPLFFGVQEGRIAKANRGKDPLYLFAALQRHLDYPSVPRPKPKPSQPPIHPALEGRLQRLEQRLKLLESEVKGEFDLSQFYVNPPAEGEPPGGSPGQRRRPDDPTD